MITLAEASELAGAAHAGPVDKAGADYFPHVCAVRDALAPYGEDAIAGVLHDVLEETPVTAEELREDGVPEHVVAAVEAVTRRPGETYMAMIGRGGR